MDERALRLELLADLRQLHREVVLVLADEASDRTYGLEGVEDRLARILWSNRIALSTEEEG